jgi:DNA-directed RNA polymerase subunit alpha
MLQPTFTVVSEGETSDYAKLIVEPLEKGYGQTLGVSLRRVMLSSIEGAAVTNVRFEGVQHQFSTLSGLKEDIVEVVLNIKQLRFSIEKEEQVVLKLSAKGPGLVTGKDINLPAGVTLSNPELVVANLADSKAKLSVEITVKKGLGYSLASEQGVTAIGDIPVDASFSPVVKVAYRVEATRVGRRTDFDKLIMEVWTDGTISPKGAMEKASQILVTHFKQVYDPILVEQPEEITLEDRIEDESLRLTVEELDLPTRIANALRKGGYKTVKDLTQAVPDEIAKVKNLGEKSVDSVVAALNQKGLTLKGL